MNPKLDHDETHSYTAAVLLARDDLAKINAYDEVVEALRSVYSALFDANEKLAHSVTEDDHKKEVEDVEGERDEALEKLEKLEGTDVEQCKTERDEAFACRDKAQKEAGELRAKLAAVHEQIEKWIGGDVLAVITAAHWREKALEQGGALQTARDEIELLKAPPKRGRKAKVSA